MPDVQIASWVPAEFAARIRQIADDNERSVAAELRLALRHWIDMHEPAEREAA